MTVTVSMSRRAFGGWRSGVAAATTVLVAAAAVVLGAAPATAQTCDPAYGCPPTIPSTTAPPTTCSVEAEIVTSGDLVDVAVFDAPANALVDLTFDGQVVATGRANASGDATITFTVPDGTGEGSHTVFAVGAGFSANCGTVQGAAVLGGGEDAGGGGSGGGGSGGAGAGAGRGSDGVLGGSLARTGIEIGLLLAVALVLVLAGHRFLRSARRRRRRAARRLNDVPALTARR